MTEKNNYYLTQKNLYAIAYYKFGEDKVKSVTKVGAKAEKYLITLENGDMIYMSRKDMFDIANEAIETYNAWHSI